MAMEILFVVDSVEGLEHKIELLEPLSSDIKFFVRSDLVPSMIKKKKIVKQIVAMFSKNVNITIDKYLRADAYKPTDTLVYYSSVELTAEMVNAIRDRLVLKPSTIYVKKKLNWWGRVKLWCYNKLVHLLFGCEDAYASTKLQYFSADIMTLLKDAGFKNHIFAIPGAVSVELEQGKEKSYYAKPKFNKNYLFNPIAFCFVLICYVLLEKFFKLPFWTYLLFILLLITVVINTFAMIIKDVLDTRYKK